MKPKVERTRPIETVTEDQVQQAIKDFLALLGYDVWDSSQPFRAYITPGMADLYVVGRGHTFWIECKSESGVQSDEQKAFERKVVANGGLYLVARSVADVKEFLARIGDAE